MQKEIFTQLLVLPIVSGVTRIELKFFRRAVAHFFKCKNFYHR